jgi:DNA-directed RNA polymerase subunit RPC12/RpoP
MYCSTCGTLVDDKLNFCKNCGSKLVKENDEDTPKTMLDNILTTLCVVVIFGLGILIGLIAVLLGYAIDHKAVVLIAIGYLVGLFGICYMLLSQVPKLINARLKSKPETSEIAQPAQLFTKTTVQLEEHREPTISVTENTTRTLEEVPMSRN